MRRSPFAAALALALAALGLAACSGPAAQPPPASAPATATPTPTPTPEPDAIVITLDELRLVDADDTALATVSLRDGDVIVFLEDALGSAPTVSTEETYGITLYDWDGIGVIPLDGTRGGRVSFTAAESGGLALRTDEGLVVGATRDEAVALGAEPGFLDEETGYDILQLDTREEPGTESLEHPGETGVVYISIVVEKDIVTQIGVPGNDFSDL